MKETDYLAGRVRELANKAYQNEYITHTDFLSASELAGVYDGMIKEKEPVHFCLYGGREEADRNVLVFCHLIWMQRISSCRKRQSHRW